MKKTLRLYLIMTCTLLLAACTQDELISSTEKAEDILSFTVTNGLPAFEEAQTRSSGIGVYSPGKTEWEAGDEILVQAQYNDNHIAGVVLTCQADGVWQADRTLASKNIKQIDAYYAPLMTINEDGNIVLKDNNSSSYLSEYIRLESPYLKNNIVEINFFLANHREYNRLRIATELGGKVSVTFDGNFTTPDNQSIQNLSATPVVDDKGNAYIYGSWGNGTLTVSIGEQTRTFSLTEAPADEKAYVIDCWQGIDLSAQSGAIDIEDDAEYHFRGSTNNPINITKGSPTIYLYGVDINAPISVTDNANATIHVVGASNHVSTSGNSSGVFVDESSTVTIEGSGKDDALTVQGGYGAAGIGGYSDSGNGIPCGKIIIRNVTLTANSGEEGGGGFAAGIGAAANAEVKSIEISNAVVYAKGGGDGINIGAAAIGGGVDTMSGDRQTSFDEIRITDSEIHATKRCPYASYIGAGGMLFNSAGYDIISTAVITNSIIYNESGAEITR